MSENYTLYQYESCPFCYRVRLFLDEAGITLPLKDTMMDRDAFVELIRGGGSPTFPFVYVLRIHRETYGGYMNL
ncbi:MAG: hypothetical protein CM1200mP24_09440 [Gammaproteobacteria bacterium]|nr:MAG: hypothetical protein CM1200mP24_09440 [Gammaproteobacteria bacterium]